jgi:thiamine-phosphate pyrophosphorylase
MKLHALVEDLEAARAAVDGGATVVQLRRKGATTNELVEAGAGFRDLGVTFVVNDDVEAALRLEADGVHLGRTDEGAERALEAGLLLGLSASTRREAAVAEYRGAGYIGAGPVWATPSKPDASPAIGLDGLREICQSVSVPVVAIGGIDASNAADCIRAGATGVAVIRALAEIRELAAAL